MEISFPSLEPISPIQVSPGTRTFVDRNGSPVFWLGDTQWELFRLFTPDTAMKILLDRQGKGFNIILIMLTGVKAFWESPSPQAPYANLYGEQPWNDADPLKPNEAYFQHIDTMIRLGESTGQTFVVGIYHQWHEEIITLDKARTWARWVARRYRDVPNLIWSMYPKAQSGFIPMCRELAAGLQEGDGGAHLISVHPDPSVASSSFMHAEPWLAFNMIQTCVDYDQIYPAVTADYLRIPVKPVVMAEGGYEGLEFDRLQTPHHIRKQAYWTQLAGGHHVYGHNDSWCFPLEWDRWLDSQGSRDLRVFRDVITACPAWWTLVPDPASLLAGAGSGYSLNTAARSEAGRWLLVYLSEPSQVKIDPARLPADWVENASWIDPRDGSRTPARSLIGQSQGTFASPPGWQDALLLVEGN